MRASLRSPGLSRRCANAKLDVPSIQNGCRAGDQRMRPPPNGGGIRLSSWLVPSSWPLTIEAYAAACHSGVTWTRRSASNPCTRARSTLARVTIGRRSCSTNARPAASWRTMVNPAIVVPTIGFGKMAARRWMMSRSSRSKTLTAADTRGVRIFRPPSIATADSGARPSRRRPVLTASVPSLSPMKLPRRSAVSGAISNPPPLIPTDPRSKAFAARKPRLTVTVAFTVSVSSITAPVWNVNAFIGTRVARMSKLGSGRVLNRKYPWRRPALSVSRPGTISEVVWRKRPVLV